MEGVIEKLDSESSTGVVQDGRILAALIDELTAFAKWIRSPAVNHDDARDDMARALENRVRYLQMQIGSHQEGIEPVFVEGGVSLYGKLRVLSDKARTDEGSGIFWGELSRDNGERWRIQFEDKDEPTVTRLWRKQVIVIGTACYYQIRSPKLIAERIDLDVERDYEVAYEELFGCDRGNNPIDFQTLLSRRYGDD